MATRKTKLLNPNTNNDFTNVNKRTRTKGIFGHQALASLA